MSLVYCCGPTVYDKVHIGNLRVYVFLDYFLKVYPSLRAIVNITDIDDKILEKTTPENFLEFIKKYTDYYTDCLKKLRITKTIKFESCVDNMSEIINIIKELELKKSTYYSDEKKGLCFENDSVLWKNTTDNVKWQSPWGQGRPGWHIECAALIYKNILNFKLKKLKLKYHLGGLDLKPIHNANEQVYLEKLDVKVERWINVFALTNNGVKMSKSLNNTVYLEDLNKNAYFMRFFLLYQNYNKELDYSEKIIEMLEREYNLFLKYVTTFILKNEKDIVYKKKDSLNRRLKINLYSGAYIKSFYANLKKLDEKIVNQLYYFNKAAKILPAKIFKINNSIKKLINERESFKKQKKYDLADKIKVKLAYRGYNIFDINNDYLVEPILK